MENFEFNLPIKSNLELNTEQQILVLLKSKNFRAIKNIFDLVIEDQPEALSVGFIERVDILEQVLDDNISEEEISNRNYPSRLEEFTEKLVEEFITLLGA